MGIEIVREVARADMNDDLRVSVWQEKRELDLTPDEARQFAREITAAADEADRVRAEMELEAEKSHPIGAFVTTADGQAVL